MTAATAWRTIADLPPVDLAELTASAALLTRVDRKYLLDPADLPQLLTRLGDATRVLEIDSERSIAYTSTYLDTPDLASYSDAAHGRRRRWKARTRTYATGGRYLEVKTRRGPTTVKERMPWSASSPDAVRLDTVGRDFVEASLAGAGIRLDAATLAPTLVTRYRRTTLLLPGCARATLDSDLTWAVPGGAPAEDLGGAVVLETKSGHDPSDLDRLLWRLGRRPVRLSKYAVGMAALDHTLPANRWHRILTTLARDAA